MTMTRAFRCVLVLMVATFGLSATALAQTNDEIFPALQWNFSTPGARANAMGRSFIGIADDATAAIANPAGLLSLTRPQGYVEYKNTRLKVDRLAAPDSLVNPAHPVATNTSIINALSFLSVSAPISSKIAVAFSVHRYLDYHEAFSLEARDIAATTFTFFPVAGSADFTGTAIGGSVAVMVTNALRLGVTISGNQLKADSEATRADITNNRVRTGLNVNRTSIHDTQFAMSASVGALYRFNDMLSVGFNYGRSPKFKTTETLAAAGTTVATNQTYTVLPGFPKDVQINVPDHFGFGVSVRPTSKLLLAGDVVRMQYSSLTKSVAIIFNTNLLTGTEYATPDVSEVHVGAEYNVYSMNGNPIFIRAGVFTNPAHVVTFTGTADRDTNASESAKFNLLPRTDETRGTFGVGIALGPRAQIDAAYVFSKEFVASAALRF